MNTADVLAGAPRDDKRPSQCVALTGSFSAVVSGAALADALRTWNSRVGILRSWSISTFSLAKTRVMDSCASFVDFHDNHLLIERLQ